jgi:hypothetical protein
MITYYRTTVPTAYYYESGKNSAKCNQKVYRNLILSMPNRIQAVIAANGGNTKY